MRINRISADELKLMGRVEYRDVRCVRCGRRASVKVAVTHYHCDCPSLRAPHPPIKDGAVPEDCVEMVVTPVFPMPQERLADEVKRLQDILVALRPEVEPTQPRGLPWLKFRDEVSAIQLERA